MTEKIKKNLLREYDNNEQDPFICVQKESPEGFCLSNACLLMFIFEGSSFS